MLKIVGVQRKTGEYQGNHYDNIMIHCLQDECNPPCIAGSITEFIKIKYAELGQVFGGAMKTDNDFRALIGMQLIPFYDKFGRVLRAEVVDYVEKGGK